MSKITKASILLLVTILAGMFLFRLLFDQPKEPFDPNIYKHKLKPINFPPKKIPQYDQNENDIAMKFVHIWKMAEKYDKAAETCLDPFEDQHPNNLVQKQNLTSLYGIEIGTSYWYELTSAYEKYATEICYSYSGSEAENIYAEKLKEKLSEREIAELLEFFNNELGKKFLSANDDISDIIQNTIAQKQREAVARELNIYNRKIEEIQKKNE